ncbi:hypothetical protein GCM10019016_059160 [Streptomyces prasinosporus]|uniref:Secreted protein n=1 Tax=Streptomyces prasinosporus TaxID=68256 RepID=A0ABP6TTZ3_9ACTN
MRGWTGRVRRLTTGAAAVAAAVALMVGGASPASAGGPTSVLVVSPQSEETASLYYADEEYGELERLLGPAGAGTREKPPEADLAAARLVNVTWMVHDVTPWRVDRVFLGDMGEEVWIHTAARLTEPVNGHWHRAEYPSDVHKFLFGLDVMGEATGTASVSGTYPAPWETERSGPGTDREAAEAAPGARAATAADDGTDWWWVIPGAVAGAALALVLRPYVTRWPLPRRRKDGPGPRQQLLDV